jgi:anti-sigma B factor antagonist
MSMSMPMLDSYFDLKIDYATRSISLGGEFDVATAVCLATAVSRFQRAGPGDVTLRIADVTFIDAAGLGAVVNAQSRQAANGACLVVVGATDAVRRVFALGGLTHLLRG